MSHGDHIRILTGAEHVHAIDCGDRTVLFLAAGRDGSGTQVRRSLLSELARGADRVEVVRHAHAVFPPQMVVARAFSRLGDPSAGSMFRSSEHFAAWCLTGQAPLPHSVPALPVAAPATPGPGALARLRAAVEKGVAAPPRSGGKGGKAVPRGARKGRPGSKAKAAATRTRVPAPGAGRKSATRTARPPRPATAKGKGAAAGRKRSRRGRAAKRR
jgi:hypothetical protein